MTVSSISCENLNFLKRSVNGATVIVGDFAPSFISHWSNPLPMGIPISRWKCRLKVQWKSITFIDLYLQLCSLIGFRRWIVCAPRKIQVLHWLETENTARRIGKTSKNLDSSEPFLAHKSHSFVPHQKADDDYKDKRRKKGGSLILMKL